MPSPSPALPRARWRRAVAAVGAVVLSSTLVGGGLFAAQTTATAAPAATVVPTAVTATGTATSVAKVAGKAQGSGKWGFVGDVESYDGKATSTYGVAVSPLDGSLWVTDSGKVVFSTFGCALLGFSGVSSCQSGSPGVLHYPATGTAGTDYLGNGGFKAATSAASAGVNAGVGAQYAPLAEAGRIDYPGPGTATEMRQHGPRGIAVTDDGVAWYADSEAIAPLGGPGGTMGRADKDMNVLPGAGYTAPWGQHREPGVTLYHSGAAIDSQGRVWTNSETADRMVIFNADGTPNGEMPLDLVFPDTGKPDYRNPTSVAIDKADDSVYVPLINFRDDKLMGSSPFLEKRDKAGNVIAKFTAPNFPKNQVVMGAAVDPVTRHVFAWTQSNTGSATAPAVMEWTKDGEFVAQFGTADVPELSTVRGMSFDKNGYRYLTVNEGSTRTRVVIMAQTPEPVTTACAPRSADGTSVKLSWDCEGPTAEGDSYGQAPVLDYVVEQREVGTTAWSVVPHAASTEKTRTIDGLDPTKEYEFRISAWNEAGNGDWASVTSPVADPQDDAISAAFGGTGSIDALANDTFGASVDTSTLTLLDAAGQPATAVTIEGQGSYELSGSTVTFVPVAGFTGKADPVTYRVTSDVDCYVTAQVTATVGAPATLTLTKKVDGDEGAAEASAWTLTATGEGDAKASGTTGEAAVTEAKLPAGNYALSEEGPTLGYASDGFVCTTDGGDAAPASHAVVLEAGTATECVVTNSYKAPVTTSPTPTETETPTPTETETPTPTETETPTPTETETPTPTETETPTPTETETPTPTETETPTPTETETPTPTETETPSPTPTETETPTPTETETGAPTESGSGTPTSSPSSSDEPSTTTPGSPSTSAAPSQSTTSASTPAPTHGGSTDSTPSSSSPSALPNTGFGSGWMLALAVAIIAAAVAMMTVGRPRRRH